MPPAEKLKKKTTPPKTTGRGGARAGAGRPRGIPNPNGGRKKLPPSKETAAFFVRIPRKLKNKYQTLSEEQKAAVKNAILGAILDA